MRGGSSPRSGESYRCLAARTPPADQAAEDGREGVRVDKKVETSKKLSQKQLYANRLYVMAGEAKAESEM